MTATETKVAHTPGPWTLDADSAYKAHRGYPENTIVRHNGMIIAVLRPDASDPFDAREIEANARLIATAPDLLEACEQLLMQFKIRLQSSEPDEFELAAIADAEAAIAKATA